MFTHITVKLRVMDTFRAADATERDLGNVLKSQREELLLSQTELADKMRAAGFKWSQATVWSVESGERPLRLSEAIAVAACCGFDPALFFGNYKPATNEAARGVTMSIKALQDLLEKMQ